MARKPKWEELLGTTDPPESTEVLVDDGGTLHADSLEEDRTWTWDGLQWREEVDECE